MLLLLTILGYVASFGLLALIYFAKMMSDAPDQVVSFSPAVMGFILSSLLGLCWWFGL